MVTKYCNTNKKKTDIVSLKQKGKKESGIIHRTKRNQWNRKKDEPNTQTKKKQNPTHTIDVVKQQNSAENCLTQH